MERDPVVRAHFDAGIGLQAVSLCPSQKFAALACRTHVQVVQLVNGQDPDSDFTGEKNDPRAISPVLRLQLPLPAGSSGASNFTMTDVAWSPLDENRVAASATNGAIAVFNLHPKGFASSLQLQRQQASPQPSSPRINQGVQGVSSQGQVTNSSRQASGLKAYSGNHIEWEAGEEQTSRAVNRIHWHPSERDTLLSANQDGTVRIFVTRSNSSNSNNSTITLNAQADACRDAQFNPFHSHILASIYENGNVAIWDRRMPEQTLLRLAAHTESGLALDWNPAQTWLLATASRDKTVKVWDLANTPAIASFSETFSASSRTSTSSTSRHASRNISLAFSRNSVALPPPVVSTNASGGGGGGGGTAKHKPLYVLHTSTTVGRVSWRPVSDVPHLGSQHVQTQTQLSSMSSENSSSHPFHVASSATNTSSTNCNSSAEISNVDTAHNNQKQGAPYPEVGHIQGPGTCTQLASTSSAERGEISIWDISRSTDLPACVLRGHSEGCTGFVWLQTLSPIGVDLGEHTDGVFGSADHDASHLSGLNHASSLNLKSTSSSAASAATARKRLQLMHGSKSSPMLSAVATQDPKSSTKGIKSNHPPENKNKPLTAAIDDDVVLHKSGIFQHLFTIGKDGNMLVQDLRNAYFPGEHISRHVVAFSAMGHVAYQRGSIVRGDPLSLVSNVVTQLAPGWFRDQPSVFGVKLEHMAPALGLEGEVESKLETEAEVRGSGMSEVVSEVKESKDFLDGGLGNRGGGRLMDHIQAGVITMGMSDFSHLAASLDTMGTGAEGGAYDPTVIKYLADHYVYSQSPPSLISFSSADGGGIKDALCSQVDRAVQQAISACQNNGKVAAAIGLAGHAATWSAMESLLPSLVNIATSQLKTQQKAQVSAIGASPPHMETSDATASPPAPTTQQNDLSPSLIMPVSTSSSSYSWELMFTIETTGDLLFDMLDSGDCQHFVTLCEVIRAIDKGQTLAQITKHCVSELRIREGYVSYLDMLNRLCLFSHANALIRSSTDRYISQLSRQGVIMRACCAKCGKEVGDNEVQTAVGAVWCGKCKRCAGLCVLCQKPVAHMLQWCPVCGHGGHSACLQQWFSQHLTCPSGCGHRCSMKCRKPEGKSESKSEFSQRSSSRNSRGSVAVAQISSKSKKEPREGKRSCDKWRLQSTNKITSRAISRF